MDLEILKYIKKIFKILKDFIFNFIIENTSKKTP